MPTHACRLLCPWGFICMPCSLPQIPYLTRPEVVTACRPGDKCMLLSINEMDNYELLDLSTADLFNESQYTPIFDQWPATRSYFSHHVSTEQNLRPTPDRLFLFHHFIQRMFLIHIYVIMTI